MSRKRASTVGVLGNVVRRRAYQRGHYHNNKDIHRHAMRKYLYGLDEETWQEMLIEQDGRCFICKRVPSSLVVDHDHDTGMVRSLLCVKCNTKVGMVENDIGRIMAILEYLKAQL